MSCGVGKEWNIGVLNYPEKCLFYQGDWLLLSQEVKKIFDMDIYSNMETLSASKEGSLSPFFC